MQSKDLSQKSQKSHQFKILLTEPSAKDERRMSEGSAKDNTTIMCPIHNSKFKISPMRHTLWQTFKVCQSFSTPPQPHKSHTSHKSHQFKIQNSKFKILHKALIIKHYFVPLPPAKAVIVFGTIYAMFLW